MFLFLNTLRLDKYLAVDYSNQRLFLLVKLYIFMVLLINNVFTKKHNHNGESNKGNRPCSA